MKIILDFEIFIVVTSETACRHGKDNKAPALNPSLVMNGVILGYDDDGDHVPELGVKGVYMNTSNLFGKTQKSGHSQQSLLSLTA